MSILQINVIDIIQYKKISVKLYSMFKCKDYSNKGLKIKFLPIPQNPQY